MISVRPLPLWIPGPTSDTSVVSAQRKPATAKLPDFAQIWPRTAVQRYFDGLAASAVIVNAWKEMGRPTQESFRQANSLTID
jgi:hypothetical protein